MSVTISLANDGSLQMTIPHESGETTVALRQGNEVEAIARVLQAQANGTRRHTGFAAAPTQAELVHNARHGTFPDPRCVFCKALAAAAGKSSKRAKARPVVLAEHGGVVIRRIQAKSKKISRDVTLEMLGL